MTSSVITLFVVLLCLLVAVLSQIKSVNDLEQRAMILNKRLEGKFSDKTRGEFIAFIFIPDLIEMITKQMEVFT